MRCTRFSRFDPFVSPNLNRDNVAAFSLRQMTLLSDFRSHGQGRKANDSRVKNERNT
jgi:hypothetical protein